MEKKEPKFKVDDWVTIKGIMSQDDMFHILEVIQQTCEAGIVQVKYLGRHYVRAEVKIDGARAIENRWFMEPKEQLLREIELGELTKGLS